MADNKKLSRSSYDDYIETINKLTPQLRTILSHISGEQANHRSHSSIENNIEDVQVKAGATCTMKQRNKKMSSSSKTKQPSSSNSARMSSSRSSGAPVRKRNIFGNSEQTQIMQAVTNGGKIVYGTIKEGKLEVQGMVGEINQDLLGIESVNAGKKTNKSRATSRKPTMKGGMHKIETINNIEDGHDFGMD
ncbi:virion core protein [White-tailed deer poxvirus]|nr:virion core protein [White-tailed deer poxvirus]